MITHPYIKKYSSRLLVAGVSAISVFLSTIPATAEDDPPPPFLVFDGADSRIVTDANATALGINARNSKTMEAWVKIRAFNDAAVMDIGPRGSNGQNFGLTARDNGRWRVHCWGNDLDFPEPASAATLNHWAHLAITYDGTRLRGFINGEQVAERTQHSSRILNTSDAQPFQIGVDSRLATYFKGEMRDVRVWNTNRNAGQIQSTMHSPPLDEEGNPLPNLRAWWPMDEGTGSVVHDLSGNGHHATIIGAQWPSLQYEFEEMEADFTKDFGTGPAKDDELSLLRNRADHWTLQEDALRMSPVTDQFVSTGALASVTNREPGREFTLETEVKLTTFMDARANRAGLIALAGPHTPLEAPFDVGADQDFYAFAFYPGAPQSIINSRFPDITPAEDGTAVIEISRGFNGPVLAAVAWEGRKPLPFPTTFADDFEDLDTVTEDFSEGTYTDSDWVVRGLQDTWEIGTSTVGPTPGSARVAATRLNSIVPTFSDDSLFSPVIDLSGVDAAILSFRETHNFESDVASDGTPDARASIRVVNEDLELIVELDSRFGNTSNSGGWRLSGFVLPPEVLGQRVRVEFHMKTNHNVWSTHYGWMIDDFSIQVPELQLDAYAMKAEGSYNFLGELDLSFTVTDLKEGSNHSQTISTTDIRPLSGNLFGIGGRIQASPLGGPEFDFTNLSMALGNEVDIVASVTETARFTYLFGSNPLRVEPDRFALNEESDWELQDAALRLATDEGSGNSLATTRIVEFKDGNPIQVESDFVLASYNASVGGKVGLVLFAEDELTVLNPADSSTYYTFQYDVGAAKIVFREGMDGAILYEAPFTAGPTVGATYSLAFSGRYNQSGVFEFTAGIDDHNGGQASLGGTIVGSLETRSRFGIGAAQGGGDVWDFLSFSGNTTDGHARYLAFNGVSDVIETGLKASALGLSGNAPKTIEAWAYTQSFNGGGPIQLGRSGTNNQDFSLRTLGTTNLWRAQFWGGADFDFTPAVQTHNAWTHLAMAYDGELVRVFVNGELTSIVERNLNTQDHAVGMRIGQWSGDFFHGAIRDVRLWNVARTEAQVADSMHTSPLGQSGLLAWWPLDEGVKDVAHDRSGNNRHGLIGRPQWVSVARTISIGDADDVTNHLDLTGQPGQVVRTTATASDLGVEGDKPKTIEAWALTRIFNGGGIMQLGERGTTGRDFSLRTRPNETDRYMAQFWGTPDVIFTVPGSSNSWTHFAITYDGSNIRIYANGQPVGGRDGAELNTGGGPFEIGEWNNNFFNGSVRDVRIWNVARSAEEIQENMNASPAGQTGLVGWWPLGEGLGNTARDESGGGRHGTILTPRWGGTFDLGNRSAKVVRNGTPVFLQWNSTYASSTSISEIGEVGFAGFAGLVAPANTATVHTLTAPDHYGVGSTPMVWVRSVPVNGFESLRYVKFEIPDGDALRSPHEDAIHLSQFLFYRNGSRVDAVAVTNPGGDNPSGEEASNLLGINPDTKWVDFNKAYLNDSHLVFDFGAVVEIDSYQIGTANDAAGRDPHRWRLYGRSSLADDWELIEDMDLNFALPGERQALTAVIPLAGAGFTFSDWLDSFFTDPADRNNPEISGRLAAPAGDGVANILKYAFGLDPRIPVGSSELTQSELEGDKLRLTYLERIGATDIGYQPEKSFGLDGWDDDGIQEILPRQPTADGEFEWVTVEIDVNGEARAFLRVKILDLE